MTARELLEAYMSRCWRGPGKEQYEGRKEILDALAALDAEQEAKSILSTALQNIAAESIIANTVKSMAGVAQRAISEAREAI